MTPYKLIPLALILIFGACASSPQKWTKSEKIMAKTFIAGQAINYLEIEFIMKHDEWNENNPWINEIHKEFGMEGIAIWKAGTTAIALTAANNLPKWRKWILVGTNGVVWHFVIKDSLKGVGFSIRFF